MHSLRDWLTRKQKETRRGRAELLLADRAAVWNARPENRQLPSLLQWLNLQVLTRKRNWTPPQRKMMRRAGRFHLLRGLMFTALLAGVVLLGWDALGRLEAHNLRGRLLGVKTAEVPDVIKAMAPIAAGRRRCCGRLMPRPRSKATPPNNCTPAWPCCPWTPARSAT